MRHTRLTALLILAAMALPDGTGISLPSARQHRSSEPPVCDAGGPYYGTPISNCLVEFDGSGSFDPDGSPLVYAWVFGDGSSAVGVTVSHHYDSVAVYQVTLTVTDENLETAACVTTADISYCGDCPPVCNAAGPYYGVAGQSIEFDGTGSWTPYPCLPIVLYQWDFGDGGVDSGPIVRHAYSMASNYMITLTVTDSDGAPSTCSTTAVVTRPEAIDPVTWGRIKARAVRSSHPHPHDKMP